MLDVHIFEWRDSRWAPRMRLPCEIRSDAVVELERRLNDGWVGAPEKLLLVAVGSQSATAIEYRVIADAVRLEEIHR